MLVPLEVVFYRVRRWGRAWHGSHHRSLALRFLFPRAAACGPPRRGRRHVCWRHSYRHKWLVTNLLYFDFEKKIDIFLTRSADFFSLGNGLKKKETKMKHDRWWLCILFLGHGSSQLCGTVDFLPNGGGEQPGCGRRSRENLDSATGNTSHLKSFQSCSRLRAVDLFLASLTGTAYFLGHQCSDEYLYTNVSRKKMGKNLLIQRKSKDNRP